MNRLKALLKLHEGVKRFPYRCTAGKLTIGVGFNLDDVGLYPDEIDYILGRRIDRMKAEVYARWPWVRNLDEVREAVILDMAFNLGTGGLAKFRKFLACAQQGNWAQARREMMDSRWATQVGGRAIRLGGMMETGQWPESLTL